MMNDLGSFVYLRTYSRWMPEEGRRETFQEMARRVALYNVSLDKSLTQDEALEEAEKIVSALTELKVFPAGRSMWIGGTEAVKKTPLANFNCSFRVIDSLEAFVEGFYVLLCGTGFGFRVLPKDIEKLPALNTSIVLANKPYNPKEKWERREDTVQFIGDGTCLIVVGDSKKGWVDALKFYLEAMQRDDLESIILNYDSVRPKGELLKTFGGRASGHEALRDMFRGIHTVIRSAQDKVKEGSNRVFLAPIDCMDIMNLIGYNVVVGGVRRTSEICLFDPNDQDILNAKVGLFEEGHKNFNKTWRFMSNNSIFFEEKPDKGSFDSIQRSIQQSSEPGFINAEASRKRRQNYEGTNPCAEILLSSAGTCNLSEVNVFAFVGEDGFFKETEFYEAVKLATRIGVRMTLVDLELPTWDATQKRDRLTGVSLTGIMDALDALDMSILDFSTILSQGRWYANKEAQKEAYRLRIPVPLLVTCIKPSGTVSQLPTVSSGAHRSFAPFYVRRVRITSTDPLAKVMLDLGYPTYPETGQGPNVEEFNSLSPSDKYAALEKANTWVIEFPVRTAAKIRSSEESALDQYYRYQVLQEYWSDHNTSITISVGDDEWNGLFSQIYDTWEDYIGISFIPKDKNIYPLMPYEAIDEAEYHKRSAHIKEGDIYTLLTERERADLATEVLDDGCETGVCAVR